MTKITAFIFIFLALTQQSVAISYKTWSDANEDTKLTYIKGVGEGFSWAHTFARSDFQRNLFCPPESLGLTARQYASILEGFVTKKKA
ncbi:hypothetical protein [Brucella gallinifaecis]|uniref:hypothetical protein n=1 Tax=Brucella gallinifaecis TaxID=215590 RepID=UPI0023618F0C|nr:hypothetical protein [Brucella gallinifaecis]